MFFRPLKLELRNFQSFGNNITTFNLDFRKSVLIIGRNLDSIVDGQIDSNGAGKTTIINGMSFAVYDKTISGNPLNGIVNNINGKNLEANFEFQGRDTLFYRIERFKAHKAKGGNGVLLLRKNTLEEAWDVKLHDITKDAIRGVDIFIAELIGIPFEIFARIMVISATYEPFLDMGLPDQRKVVEELFGYTEISNKADKLKEIVKNNIKDMEALEKVDEQIKDEIERYNKLLTETKEKETNWSTTNANELATVAATIKEYADIDFDVEEERLIKLSNLIVGMESIKQTLNTITEKISNNEKILTNAKEWEENRLVEIQKLEEELNELPTINIEEQQQYLTQIQNLRTIKAQKEKQISDIQDIINSNNTKFESRKIELTTINDRITQVSEIDIDEEKGLLDGLIESKEKLDVLVNVRKETTTTLEYANKDLLRANNAVSVLTTEIDLLNSSECPYCHQEYKDSECKTKLDDASAKVTTLALEIKQLEETVTKSTDTLLEIDSDVTKLNDYIQTNKCLFKTVKELNDFVTKVTKLNTEKDAATVAIDSITEILTINTTLSKQLSNEVNQIINELNLLTEKTIFKSNDELTKFTNLVNGKTVKLATLKDGTNPYLVDTTEENITIKINTLKDELIINQTKLNTAKVDSAALQSITRYMDIRQLTVDRTNLTSQIEKYTSIKNAENPFTSTVISLVERPPNERKTDQIQELHDTIEHQQFLVKLLTKKDSFIRKALINRYIPYMNGRIKYYLEKIGLPHKVEFLQDMSVKITQFKSELSFKSLSSGQKARVNLALSFAFRDVLQSRYGAINFCILDECLDTGLGNVGVQLATKMIKAVAKEHGLSMFVISHRDEIASMFDSKLVIELKNGFSNVIESDI